MSMDQMVQFHILKSAAAAVEIQTIKARAVAAGVPDVRFGYNDYHALRGHVRITASRLMTVFLCDRLVEATERSIGQPSIDCAMGAKAALDALEASTRGG